MSHTTTSTDTSADRLPVWKHGLIAALVAAAAVAGIASIANSLGVDFVSANDPKEIPIPILGFVNLTIIFSLIGVGLAAILARTARHPRKAFLVTTLVLVALSLVPDLTTVLAVWDTSEKVALVTTHLVAAAIVIPTLARRLRP